MSKRDSDAEETKSIRPGGERLADRHDEIVPPSFEFDPLDPPEIPGWWRFDSPVAAAIAATRPTWRWKLGRWLVKRGQRMINDAEERAYREIFRRLWGEPRF